MEHAAGELTSFKLEEMKLRLKWITPDEPIISGQVMDRNTYKTISVACALRVIRNGSSAEFAYWPSTFLLRIKTGFVFVSQCEDRLEVFWYLLLPPSTDFHTWIWIPLVWWCIGDVLPPCSSSSVWRWRWNQLRVKHLSHLTPMMYGAEQQATHVPLLYKCKWNIWTFRTFGISHRTLILCSNPVSPTRGNISHCGSTLPNSVAL